MTDQAILRRPVRLFAVAVSVALLATACGSGGDGQRSAEPAREELVAHVASYDLVAGRAQRFIVGLVDIDQSLVGFGEVALAFSYLGTADEPLDDPRPGPIVTADYRLVPGQAPASDGDGPRVVSSAQGTGVYGIDEVVFEEAGFWEVAVEAVVDGETRTATAAFEVAAESVIPAVGDQAPRTENPLPGADGVPATAIDSRADAEGALPDPELHAMTVADAVTSGRPTMVVVSTPVYCVSRFCGPITDAVSALAARYGEQMNFVHLEVWRDFEAESVNEAAAEWIQPAGTGGREPWTFVVGADGIITHRFDNVATDAELEGAIQEVLA